MTLLLSPFVALVLCQAPAAPTKAATKPPPKRTGTLTLAPALKVDLNRKVVIVDAVVVFREGPMELLLCNKRGKEHESILAAEFAPKAFHTALLLAGAVPGKPVRSRTDGKPGMLPPTGHRLKIWLDYEEKGKKTRIDAREWIRDVRTKKALDADFVFAGSQIVRVPGVEKPVYLGDDGDVVCVANFPGAIVDIARRSDNSNPELLYQPWTERVPAMGTAVRVILEPVAD